METRIHGRPSRRASRRGLASFVSFLLLFAFTLGQSGSLIALADDAGTDPVATEDAVADGASGDATSPVAEVPAEEAPAEEAPAEAPAEEAPAEAPAEEAPAADEVAGDPEGSPDGGAASASRSTSRTSKRNAERGGGDTTIATPTEPTAGGPSTSLQSQPQFVSGNPTCATLLPQGSFLFEKKIEPVTDSNNVALASGSLSGLLDVDVKSTALGQTFDFDVSGDFIAVAVFVKGGPNGNLYDYRPDGADAPLSVFGDPGLGDTGLHAPLNGDRYYGLSHISFCLAARTVDPDISVDKTCTTFAQVGDTITYTITVKNTGDETLNNVTVVDTLLGNLSSSYDNTLSPNEQESHTFTYVVTAQSPDPVPNSVTASGAGATSQDTVTDTASCSTDIIHSPGIDVTKSCPRSVPFGDDIRYTITVTNTGDEALEDVTVEDTLLGDITEEFDFDFSDPFPVGEIARAVVTYSPGADEDRVSNTVVATGRGADSGVEAMDEASCDTDVEQPSIQIVKDGPAQVHRGETITYAFEVTNIGDIDLFDVELTDPICDLGSITLVDDDDGDAILAVGEAWRYLCTHLVTDDDPDPIPNTGFVRGDTAEGQEGGEEVTDSDDHVVDLIHPDIDIVKTVDEDIVSIGDTVTYTYVIMNTGDTTLYDISVDDDILGHIGDIDVLEPGRSATLTKDFVMGNQIVINVGLAEGEDILGRSVSADDDATVTPIAGANPSPPNDTPTPFTGSDAGRLGLIAMVLFGLGVTVVATTRGRRPEREPA